MTATEHPPRASRLDPITLEVLRNRLEAVAEDAASTIQRTSVSPVITESHDYGVSLLDGDGNLLAGAGWAALHYAASTRAVRATIERYGDDITADDVYLANDPYNGGGLHANDVMVQRPVFVDGRRIAWVAVSAHMVDIGGMVMGSFAPAATDAYQEALRLPPVRLFKRGVEVSDVWDIVRVNVRMSTLLEMDLRGLVASTHVAQEKVLDLVDTLGIDTYLDGIQALQQLSERELRARIAALPDGEYRADTWADWDDELFRLPCTLTIEGDHMVFDFTGASPQAPHPFNAQPYIVKSYFMMGFQPLIAADLPYTEGLLKPFEVRCPEASIVDARPPAPNNMGHMHVAAAASEVMLECVRLAMWAADEPVEGSQFVHGWSAGPAMAVTSWSGIDVDGVPAGWAMVDGTNGGAAAFSDLDGTDAGVNPVGMASPPASPDIEVLESWYPMLVTERRLRPGVNGAGAHRSGAGLQMKLQPYGTPALQGQMLGYREWLPLDGVAGGRPGANALFQLRRADGTVERIPNKAADVVLREGEVFEFLCPTGGGAGDPLDRDPGAVAEDVLDELIDAADAAAVYGVALDAQGAPDAAATAATREAMRADRLARARPAARPLDDGDLPELAGGGTMPLYPGVVQRGAVAYAEVSEAPLARAPHHWTDGCPVLETARPGPGPALVERAYLDPRTGRALHVGTVPAGEPRAFAILPVRWTALGGA